MQTMQLPAADPNYKPEPRPDEATQWSINLGLPKLYWSARVSDFALDLLLPNKPCNLLLRGPTGTGKTHAACALLNFWRCWGSRLYTAKHIANEFRACFSGRGESENDVLAWYCQPSALVIDDLGAENQTDGSVANLYALVNERINRKLVTVVTTNKTMRELDAMDPRLASRLGGFEQVVLSGSDRRVG